jgi:opacity protein-like surface antigen
MRRYLTVVSVLLLLGASSARAEILVTGFGGVAFGGATTESRGTYGGALGFLGAGVVGFEIEGATTPDFFGTAGGGAFTENNVLTLMGNLLLAAPAGPVRIYGTAGAGILKTRLEDPDRLLSIDSNDFGINVGGGLIVYLGDHVGLRGDVRYFRDLQDADPDGAFDVDFGNVDYWRGVAGITFKF